MKLNIKQHKTVKEVQTIKIINKVTALTRHMRAIETI
jgi:hypothetical protein